MVERCACMHHQLEADLLDICKNGDLDVSKAALVARGLDPRQVHLRSMPGISIFTRPCKACLWFDR